MKAVFNAFLMILPIAVLVGAMFLVCGGLGALLVSWGVSWAEVLVDLAKGVMVVAGWLGIVSPLFVIVFLYIQIKDGMKK